MAASCSLQNVLQTGKLVRGRLVGLEKATYKSTSESEQASLRHLLSTVDTLQAQTKRVTRGSAAWRCACIAPETPVINDALSGKRERETVRPVWRQ